MYFAGPFMGNVYLIGRRIQQIAGNHIEMKTTTAEETVAQDDTGTPWAQQVVSDNGPQFTAEIFKKFMKENGIRHMTGIIPPQTAWQSDSLEASNAR